MNIQLLHQDIKALITQIPCTVTPKIIVGLSGGADSVFLLHHLVLISKQMPLEIIAAHLNHGWRGKDDEIDEQFCQNLAQQLGITLTTANASDIVIKQQWNGSQEELGRNQRHTFLQNVATQSQADVIALGHNAQDQEELFFIRLIRGTSLEGLCGMKEYEGNIIRPLLQLSREEIETWLTEANQPWQHDSDNDNRRFLRNRIRHELLPLLRTIEPRFTATFSRTHMLLNDEQGLIEELVLHEFGKVFTTSSSPLQLSMPKDYIEKAMLIGNLAMFKALNPMLQRHVFKKLCQQAGAPFPGSLGIIDEALRFLNNPRGGTHEIMNGWILSKKTDLFWLMPQL